MQKDKVDVQCSNVIMNRLLFERDILRFSNSEAISNSAVLSRRKLFIEQSCYLFDVVTQYGHSSLSLLHSLSKINKQNTKKL